MDYQKKYIKELSKIYVNNKQVTAEIINLTAITNLPKGTEHFISDIHGEYEIFLHILKTASGVIQRKIRDEFKDTLSDEEKYSLATLIYYPKEKLKFVEKTDEWYKINLSRLIRVTKRVGAKYTRSKVRKCLPYHYSYIIDELLNCNYNDNDKQTYYNSIIDNILSLDKGDDFVIELSNLIQSLAVDHLHIVGDIFDRGPRADIILDYLRSYRSLDIQWGNHDVLWIGAGLGDIGCILSVLCDCFKYNNLELLEDGYSINLLPLYTLVNKYYSDCSIDIYKSSYNTEACARLLKATMVLRAKIEDRYKTDYPDFNMQNQTVLDKINFEEKTFDGYEMKECDFPTMDPNDPTKLVSEEQETIEKLINSFRNSIKLQKHLDLLMNKGRIYLCYNGNLLFHGSIPLDDNGEFLSVKFNGESYSGKNYLDYCQSVIRRAYKYKNKNDLAFIWQLWCGNKSPIFGKDKMATFERLYCKEKSTHIENKQHYFEFQGNVIVCNNILKEFGLDVKTGRIINGHIPVKHGEGESPIKAKGKMIVIDGGMSKPYQKVTGIAGYTLTYHSEGMEIAAHSPFLGKEDVVKNNSQVVAVKYLVNHTDERIKVADTDAGIALLEQIEDLKVLQELYKSGELKEFYRN